ncbi:MAG: hypothetical protein C4547_06655 [Phycisphaerales bacterium]|nr:MAG: hypothetical protein C4547_06655 [Phycisphaerales bacterium]
MAVGLQPAQAQTSEYYLLRAESGHMWVIQNGQVVREWNVDGDLEIPLTVIDTVRTYGYRPGDVGTEYALDGQMTGEHYPWVDGCGASWLDGTTDGQFAYAIQYTGNRPVCRFDLNWTNPTLLFNCPPGEQWDALTYDPTDDTFWITGRNNVLAQLDRSGNVLQRFTIPGGGRSAGLAYDAADDTFWMYRGGDLIQQYSKSGQLLQSHNVAGVSGNVWGGEFQFSPGGCVYTVKKSKSKRGCENCPEKGSDFRTDSECEDVKDCAKKLKTTIACPRGGNGICKIKGKVKSCG